MCASKGGAIFNTGANLSVSGLLTRNYWTWLRLILFSEHHTKNYLKQNPVRQAIPNVHLFQSDCTLRPKALLSRIEMIAGSKR
jgi:hypothetical protein